MARITVLVGNYGSGKTELSLNLAASLRAQGQPTALVDLDIVNPYFRSAEQKDWLEMQGIRVLAPTFALTTVDIPALPADILSVFDQTHEQVVIDVGGDDTGAAALGRYAHRLQTDDTQVLFVINACRPLSRDADSALDLLARIEQRSRIRPNGLINNTNLGDESDLATLLAGQRMVEAVSQRSGIPILAITAEPNIGAQLPDNLLPIYHPLERHMRPEFFDERP